MRYISNLASLEFDGSTYGHGDEVKVSDEARGAAEVLVGRGDITLVGEADDAVPASADPSPVRPDLSGMTKAELLDTARVEGVDVTADNNKAELLDKIEAARRG